MHMAQLMPLPHTVSCFSKIQIGFIFLVPAHPGSPGQRAVKRVCVCVCILIFSCTLVFFVQLRVFIHRQKTDRSDVAKFFFSNAVVRNRICC